MAGEDNPGRSRAVLFIGDSYLEQYWARVKHVISGGAFNDAHGPFLHARSCVPFRHRESRGPICGRFLDDALAAAKDPLVDTVVIGAFWESYFKTGRVGEAAVRPLIRINSKTADDVLSEFGAMLRSLRSSGKRVFVLLSRPHGPGIRSAVPGVAPHWQADRRACPGRALAPTGRGHSRPHIGDGNLSGCSGPRPSAFCL